VTLFEALIAAVLLVWFALSVVQQFGPRWFEHVRDYDVFGLLPLWTFFAPNPGHSDFHLVYRDRDDDGVLTNWREFVLCHERRSVEWLWNPDKRGKKVLADVAATLTDYANADAPPDDLMLSLPYLLLLNVVAGLEPRTGVTRQFAVVETFGYRPIQPTRVILVSDFHPLEADL
jgi:hypothetical protein